MTGIGDLQTLFSATQKTEASEDFAVGRQRANSTSNTADDRSLASTDRSVVSSAGGTLLAALNGSDVRADKVAKLQAAIAAGTYHVSSSDIAESLIANMLGGPVSGRS